jgi:hypothetical protein
MAIDVRQCAERTINQRWIPLNYAIAANQQYQPFDGELVVATNTPVFGTRRMLLLETPYNATRNKTIAELYADFLLTPTAQEVLAAVQAEAQARASADSTEAQTRASADSTETQARSQADASLQAQITAVKQGANVALPFQNLTDFNAWTTKGTLPPFWAQIVPPLTWTPTDARVGWLALFISTGINDKWFTGAAWADHEVTIDLSGYLTTTRAAQLYAPIQSPGLLGTPTVPIPNMQTASNNQAVSVKTIKDLALTYAPIESPAFTGIPTAPMPDFATAPDNQVEVVRNSRMIYNLVRALGWGIFRRADDDGPFYEIYRVSDDGTIQKKQDEVRIT